MIRLIAMRSHPCLIVVILPNCKTESAGQSKSNTACITVHIIGHQVLQGPTVMLVKPLV